MKLSDWRKAHGKTLADMALAVGIAGANPARSLQRYESGERVMPALFVDAVVFQTAGEVTVSDIHDVRLAWERANLAAEVGS